MANGGLSRKVGRFVDELEIVEERGGRCEDKKKREPRRVQNYSGYNLG